MSMESDKEKASAEVARTQSQLSRELANQAYPAISRALHDILGDLNATRNGSGRLNDAYKAALADMNAQFDQAGTSNAELMRQQARQSGLSFSEGQVSSAIGQQQQALDRQRMVATRGLEYQMGGANLQNYNTLLSLLGQGTNAATGISQGFLQNQLSAAGMMSGTSAFESSLAGATSGAGVGASVGSVFPGYGTAIGAGVGSIIGGVGGYLAGR